MCMHISVYFRHTERIYVCVLEVARVCLSVYSKCEHYVGIGVFLCVPCRHM